MLIVFDLDDTLIDTSGQIAPYKLHELIWFLQKKNVLSRSCEELYIEFSCLNEKCCSSKEMIIQLLDSCKALFLLKEALELYDLPLPDSFPLKTTPLARKVLLNFREKGHILALVTVGKRKTQLQKLKIAGLEPSLFSKILILEDTSKGSCYELLLKKFKVSPENCLVVGDRVPTDLAPAQLLGCKTAHMCWGRGLMWQKESWINYSIQELSDLLGCV